MHERVGGNETVRVDVRLIAATNADLEKLAAEGKFRQDLFFRLNVFLIRLPPLRDRAEDLDLLTDYYLVHFGRELGRPVPVVPPETRAVLRSYAWPGNVRELQSVLKQAFLQAGGEVLLPEFVTIPTPHALGAVGRFAMDWDAFIAERLKADSNELYAEALAIMERELLARVLTHTGGNQLRAASLLGMTRGTLRNKLRAHGVTIERSFGTDDTAD